jgi:Xaa-Pro dipeptidase
MAVSSLQTPFSDNLFATHFNPDEISLRPCQKKPLFVNTLALHAENRSRLIAALKADGSGGVNDAHSVVVLQGGMAESRHETDHEKLFRQESFFHWAFGVKEPDWFGAISLSNGKSVLFIPRLPESYAVVMGRIKAPEEFKDLYGVDDVRYEDEMQVILAQMTGGEPPVAPASFGKAGGESQPPPGALLLLKGFNTDGRAFAKPARFAGVDRFRCDDGRLWPIITELRAVKTSREIDMLRYSAAITSEGHIAVMQHVTSKIRQSNAATTSAPPLMEYQLESLFHHWCYYFGGCRHLSYTCICAAGHNGSVLHYGHAGEPNSHSIQPDSMCLFDMGAEYLCYGSDITTSFPANGKFTEKQLIIYNAVWDAVRAVEDAMKPGVVWRDMQTLSYERILTHLRDGGLLKGDIKEMMDVNLGATFMPHGLGHFLGIDTHDVGGYPAGTHRPSEAGYASLRTVRALKAGNYITVEPGCYFIDVLLDAALSDPVKSKFLVADKINSYRGFGGVRIEDDVLVTETGCENFTLSPRTVSDIEAVCDGRIKSTREITKYH